MNDAAVLILMLCAGAWLWNANRLAHEKVLAVCREVCGDLKLQQLDDTVSLRRLKLRWAVGRLNVVRIYRFEFSDDGVARRFGEIALVGSVLDWVRVDHRQGSIYIDVH